MEDGEHGARSLLFGAAVGLAVVFGIARSNWSAAGRVASSRPSRSASRKLPSARLHAMLFKREIMGNR